MSTEGNLALNAVLISDIVIVMDWPSNLPIADSFLVDADQRNGVSDEKLLLSL